MKLSPPIVSIHWHACLYGTVGRSARRPSVRAPLHSVYRRPPWPYNLCMLMESRGYIRWIYPLTYHFTLVFIFCLLSFIISRANPVSSYFASLIHLCMPPGIYAPLVGLHSDNPGLACPGIGANVQRSFLVEFRPRSWSF